MLYCNWMKTFKLLLTTHMLLATPVSVCLLQPSANTTAEEHQLGGAPAGDSAETAAAADADAETVHADPAAGAAEPGAVDSQAVTGVDGAAGDFEDPNVDEQLQDEAEEEEEDFKAFEEEEEEEEEEEIDPADHEGDDPQQGEEEEQCCGLGDADECCEDEQQQDDYCDGGYEGDVYGGEEDCCGCEGDW
jgi:hypothetical protein